jgi:hypothetical protein
VHLANVINKAHGAAVIAAWEVDELDELWIETFLGLSTLQRRQAPQKAIEKEFAKFRASHPTYRKTH